MYILPFLNSQTLLLPVVYYFHQFLIAIVTVAMGNNCLFACLTPPEGVSKAHFGLDQPHSKHHISKIYESYGKL